MRTVSPIEVRHFIHISVAAALCFPSNNHAMVFPCTLPSVVANLQFIISLGCCEKGENYSK